MTRPITACFVLTLCAVATLAQDAAKPAPDFKALHAQYEKAVAKLEDLRGQYAAAAPDKRAGVIAAFNKQVDELRIFLPQLNSAAVATYTKAPGKDADVDKFVGNVLQQYMAEDRYEQAVALADVMIANKHPHEGLVGMGGVAAFFTNDFEKAGKRFAAVKASGRFDRMATRYAELLPKYTKYWAAEKKVRAAEAKADNLPRVKLKTSKGDVVLEMFENEAPNAVANFIHLVEKKFYNGVVFHRVLPNFMAQGGDPTGTGSGGPGWNIDCECYVDNARMHFRGSLSMAHAGRNTGGSQFFLTFVPTDHLNGKHTVFGRVIEGMDVLAELNRIDPGRGGPKPDRIVEATVVRKRDHPYTPKKNANPGR